ncbi:hypothetical protein FRX31_025370 [Thalictrum thalictroides]|uniref:Uncharacterized protein n=1 Tax=Thalictrum thalictroides TaxID=46969 RepID=A0A7J6VIV3_THATH|nr:hypothetical protein FRX31_025370 [Thalictrum thalictroides]
MCQDSRLSVEDPLRSKLPTNFKKICAMKMTNDKKLRQFNDKLRITLTTSKIVVGDHYYKQYNADDRSTRERKKLKGQSNGTRLEGYLFNRQNRFKQVYES